MLQKLLIYRKYLPEKLLSVAQALYEAVDVELKEVSAIASTGHGVWDNASEQLQQTRNSLQSQKQSLMIRPVLINKAGGMCHALGKLPSELDKIPSTSWLCSQLKTNISELDAVRKCLDSEEEPTYGTFYMLMVKHCSSQMEKAATQARSSILHLVNHYRECYGQIKDFTTICLRALEEAVSRCDESKACYEMHVDEGCDKIHVEVYKNYIEKCRNTDHDIVGIELDALTNLLSNHEHSINAALIQEILER